MSAVLTIHLPAIRRNYAVLRGRAAPGCRMGAVVKANAYGLGAGEVSRALFNEGCRDFFVFSPEEGAALRKVLSDAKIGVLSGFPPGGDGGAYIENALVPALGSPVEIESYKKLGKRMGKKLPAFLNFNIRMNRMGFAAAETEKLLADPAMLTGLEIKGVMSHFACADEAGHPMTETQYEIFSAIARHFPSAEKSLCNSSGIFRDAKYHFDLARPGVALYGVNPAPETKNPMEPVVTLTAPVIRSRLVYKGAAVGYNATYVF